MLRADAQQGTAEILSEILRALHDADARQKLHATAITVEFMCVYNLQMFCFKEVKIFRVLAHNCHTVMRHRNLCLVRAVFRSQGWQPGCGTVDLIQEVHHPGNVPCMAGQSDCSVCIGTWSQDRAVARAD